MNYKKGGKYEREESQDAEEDGMPRTLNREIIKHRDRRLRSLLPVLFMLQDIEDKHPAEILKIFSTILGDPTLHMTEAQRRRMERYCEKWKIDMTDGDKS